MFVYVKTVGGSDNDQDQYCEECRSDVHLGSIISYMYSLDSVRHHCLFFCFFYG